MLDDHIHFRSVPYRFLGYGLALSHALSWAEEPLLKSLSSLVGELFVIARVANKALDAQNRNASMVPDVPDTIIFEGIATVILPALIVEVCGSAVDAALLSGRLVTLALSVSVLVLLHGKLDEAVSNFMDQTIRKHY
ncbi:hypothetical protein RRG08_013790 [Elysia crispata]|uniref:Uncharacterized protein n=1 Tax=Elysia crispata TaxID=231223 RepID=A0AAE1EDS0_9GAST|nr:hypothetical protein RRG08_013790 [Elysia crispata]